MKFANIIRCIRPHEVQRLVGSSTTGGDFYTGEEPVVSYTSSTVLGFYNTESVERYVEQGIMDINDRLFVSEISMDTTDLVRSGTVDFEIKRKITTEFLAYTGYTYILREVRT